VTCDPSAEMDHSAYLMVTCDISQNSADSEFFHVNFIHSTLDLRLNGDNCVKNKGNYTKLEAKNEFST
jgi:hypothetical protein